MEFQLKNFLITNSGQIIKFEKSISLNRTSKYNPETILTNGRIILDNGGSLAFSKMKLKDNAIIALGELLHPEEDTRFFEESNR